MAGHLDDSTTPPAIAARTARWAVLALTAAYFSYPATRVLSTQPLPRAAVALLALAAVAVLHFRHTLHGLRGRNPVDWSWTLAAQAVLSYLPAPLAGDAWLGVPSFLAAASLIVLRAPRSFVAYALVVAAEAPLAAAMYDATSRIAYACLTTALTGLVVYGFVRMAVLVTEVHELRAILAQRAVDSERLRFARDLHDVLGHTLCAIALKSDLAGLSLRNLPAKAERELSELSSLARDAHRQVRAVVAGYRNASLEGELEGVTTVLTSAGIQCDVDTPALDAVVPAAASQLAFALREGATNVLMHSAATRCRITLRHEDGCLTLRMTNDGVPATARQPAGTGLDGLRERLAGAGSVTAGRAGDGTYELIIRLTDDPST